MNEYEQHSIILTTYFFLWVALALSGIIFVASLFVDGTGGISFAVGIIFLICLVMLWLNVRKLFWLPHLMLPLLTFLLATYLSMNSFGVHDEAIMLYPLAVTLAGLLYGRKGIVFYASLSILTVLIMAVAELKGWLVTPFSATVSLLSVVTMPALLALTSLMIYLIVNYLHNVLENTRRSEHALAEGNQELQTLRDSLESLVAERTQYTETARQEAEDARRDAEAANRALEIQMWYVSGQAQLNEVFREAQDIRSMADNVTSFLCHYLELPVSVLFVHRKRSLYLMGGYAYPHDIATHFAQGDGLLGQAVLEKRTFILQDVPHPQMKVVSALGQMAPKSVMLLPLICNDQVVGILELGALRDFAPRAVQFLERVAESIGVAIHTIEARAEVDELLHETQRQAKDLQVQEKELRSTNKKLLAQAERMRFTSGD